MLAPNGEGPRSSYGRRRAHGATLRRIRVSFGCRLISHVAMQSMLLLLPLLLHSPTTHSTFGVPSRTLDAVSMPTECRKRSGGCRLTAKGWWPSECVHNVPSGAAVKALGNGVHVTYPNGTVEFMPECAAPVPAETLARMQQQQQQQQQQRRDTGTGVPVSTGQFGAYPIMWEYGIDPETAPMNHWEGTYHVGNHPETGAGGSFWVGLEPYTCDSVMQAVTYFTTSGWFVVSENCCPGGHDFRVGEVKVNDTSMPIHGVVQRIASTDHIDPSTCTANASIKAAVCNSGPTQKVPGSDKGSMLPGDCAAICESNKFAAMLGSCLGWSVVPSTVPAGLRQYQGCYLSNTSWDGTRGACPYYADVSGCSSRGVAKYAATCCGASPTAYLINTTVNGKTFTLEGDNGKQMNSAYGASIRPWPSGDG